MIQIWKMKDGYGNVAYVGNSITASTAVAQGYSSLHITKAYDTDGRVYTYDYTTGQLDWVEVKEGATVVARVDYKYYGASEDHGLLNDLKLVKVKTYLSDTGVTAEQKKYYRYYDGTYDADTNPGNDHQIKMIVGSEGTRNYDYYFDSGSGPDNDFLEDFLDEGDAVLKPYSDAFFCSAVTPVSLR